MNVPVIVIGAAAIAGLTFLAMPTLGPVVVGVAIGLVWARRPALHAGAAGVAGWGALLALAGLRGDPVDVLATKVGGAMGIPAWALFVVTLLFPAILASSAAWLGQLARRIPSRGPAARRETDVRKAA